ncbi:MAG: GIY-YIG nuclease family protein [Patescibacteria group bacterium]
MHYLYLLKSTVDHSHYIGTTDDLKRRFAQHNAGFSKATKSKRPRELCYYEAYRLKPDALRREKQLKRFAKSYSMLIRRIKESIDG